MCDAQLEPVNETVPFQHVLYDKQEFILVLSETPPDRDDISISSYSSLVSVCDLSSSRPFSQTFLLLCCECLFPELPGFTPTSLPLLHRRPTPSVITISHPGIAVNLENCGTRAESGAAPEQIGGAHVFISLI